jgi:hypothetical protein
MLWTSRDRKIPDLVGPSQAIEVARMTQRCPSHVSSLAVADDPGKRVKFKVREPCLDPDMINCPARQLMQAHGSGGSGEKLTAIIQRGSALGVSEGVLLPAPATVVVISAAETGRVAWTRTEVVWAPAL